jgi:DNA-binding response OmpR family regulator
MGSRGASRHSARHPGRPALPEAFPPGLLIGPLTGLCAACAERARFGSMSVALGVRTGDHKRLGHEHVLAASSKSGEETMAGERPILIVDDDGALRETLAEQLEVDGEFTASEAATLAEAEAKLSAAEARFDAVILDVTLPDGDGRDLCARLRRQGVRVPIIMLTGSDDESDVVRGLDAGANDYIAKPFRLAELLARVRAQLRIFENSEDAVFTIGPYTFRPSAKLLQEPAKNRRIRLTEKEAAILKFLYRAGTRPVARQVLLNEVWGYNAAVTTHTLETHIYRLRQKIEPDPANARLLVTEGGGYRLDPQGVPAVPA